VSLKHAVAVNGKNKGVSGGANIVFGAAKWSAYAGKCLFLRLILNQLLPTQYEKTKIMAHFLHNEASDSAFFQHRYGGIAPADLARQVEQAMYHLGYRHLSGPLENALYERGNRTLRILLGAFHKYFKFRVLILPEGQDVSVRIVRESSGMSGGLIGMNQVKNEFRLLSHNLMKI